MLIATSIVRNEADRYLASWLENVRTYADRHVILDDASDDTTVALIQARASRDPGLVLEVATESLFAQHEQRLRARLWELTRTVARAGDWIVVVDADDFYERELRDRKAKILARPELLVRCRYLDMWDEGHYRVDGHWSSMIYRMFRFQDQPFGPTRDGLNESPLPEYVRRVPERNLRSEIYRSSIRCIHKGWLRDSDKRRKSDFYLAHLQREFDRTHVQSVLEVRPRLRTYREDYRSVPERAARLLLGVRETLGDLTRPARPAVRRVLGPRLSAALRVGIGKGR